MNRNLMVLLCLLAPLQAAAGVVRGEVSTGALEQLKSPHQADPAFWRLGPAPAGRGLPESFVVLEGEAATNLAVDSAAAPALSLEGYGVWPATVVVRVGSSLTIRNRDPRAYDCEAKGSTDAFSLKNIQAGGEQEQKFLASGVLHLQCAGYPFMRATILVVESPLVTRLDARGEFDIKNVPEGKYKARVFAAGKWRWENTVMVQGGTSKVALGPDVAPAAEGPEDKPAAGGDEVAPAKPPAADVKPPQPDRQPPVADKPERKPPVADKPERKPPVADKPERKPPVADKPEKKPPVADKKPPVADKKPPVADKKPPAADKKPKKGDAEPAFKDVEPEIEIEIED